MLACLAGALRSPSGLTILLVVRVWRGDIVWISAINAATAHLVPQERDKGGDHHSAHQKRRGEDAQVLHQANAPFCRTCPHVLPWGAGLRGSGLSKEQATQR
jgi:hypothetical protein